MVSASEGDRSVKEFYFPGQSSYQTNRKRTNDNKNVNVLLFEAGNKLCNK